MVHAGPLEPDEVVTVCGLPVTSIARTLVDLAREHYGRAALAAADAALHHQLVGAEAVRAALLAARNRSGIGRARRLLRLATVEARASGMALRLALIDVGLPTPELQVVVRDRAGAFLGRVDLAYPDFGLIIEFDGEVKYRDLVPSGQTARDVVMAERRREKHCWTQVSSSCASSGPIFATRRRWLPESGRRWQGRRAVAAGLITGTMTVSAAITIG